ncbi:MAG: hypothetical protein A2Y33_14350 [Spirochaetes bacterium GWF1_51_8]|nr:MAG: hypothetical protein A2Y33_14350 [Spirochaetes bacterium GWF1_51_8]
MKLADIVSIALTALMGAGGLVFSTTGAKGANVLVSAPSGTFTYPLSTPRTIEVGGEHGVLTVVISNNQAAIVKSPCHNQICVHKGWCGIEGDGIICVPEKVAVKIAGGMEGLDAVSE